MTRVLDRIDRKILRELMQDATLPVARLAERVHLSQTPCWKRIRKMEETGVVTGRVALVDPARVGLGLTVFVEIEAADHSPDGRTALVRAIARMPEVVEAHRLAGDADYLLKVLVADMAAFDAFYARMTEAVTCRNVTARFSLERIRATTVLPIRPDPD